MRKWKSGGIRDTDEGKIDFRGFLCPVVLKKYGEYMAKHQTQADGKKRESDNWKKGFGDKHFDVCMSSLLRHVHDMWMEHEGEKSRDGIEDAMMGSIFNLIAYANKFYKKK